MTPALRATIKRVKNEKKLFDFLKKHNIKYRLNPRMTTGSWQYHTSNPDLCRIIIGAKDYDDDDDALISSFLHETAHVFCHRCKIYKKYHSGYLSKSYIRRMALKIERYIDKKAAKLMQEIFPKRKYRYGYSESGAREFLLKWYKID